MSAPILLPKVIANIFEHLEVDEIWELALTCRTFYNAARPFIWKKLIFYPSKYLTFMKRQNEPEFTASFIPLVQHLELLPFTPPANFSDDTEESVQVFHNLQSMHFPHFVLNVFSHQPTHLVFLSIYLDQDYKSELPFIPSHSVFPNLETLFVKGTKNMMKDFITFPFQNNPLEKHFPRLSVLYLLQLRISVKNLIAVLRRLAGLTEVHLIVQGSPGLQMDNEINDLFEIEASIPTSLPFLPHLKKFYVNNMVYPELLKAFPSSSPTLPPLQVLHVTGHDSTSILLPVPSSPIFDQLTCLDLGHVPVHSDKLIKLLQYTTALKELSLYELLILNTSLSIPSVTLRELRVLTLTELVAVLGNMDWRFLICPKLCDLTLIKMKVRHPLWPTIKFLYVSCSEVDAACIPSSLVTFTAKSTILTGTANLLPQLKSVCCFRVSSVSPLLEPLLSHTPFLLKSLKLQKTGILLKHLSVIACLPHFQLKHIFDCSIISSDAVLLVSKDNIWLWKKMFEFPFLENEVSSKFNVRVKVIHSLNETDLAIVIKGLKVISANLFSIHGPLADDFIHTLKDQFGLLCDSDGLYHFDTK